MVKLHTLLAKSGKTTLGSL